MEEREDAERIAFYETDRNHQEKRQKLNNANLELEILRLGIAPQEILDEIKASYDLMVEQHNLEYEEDSYQGEMNVYEQSPYLKSLPNNVKSRFQNDYDQWSKK